MTKARQILCIDPEPPELHIEALLNRRGIAAAITEASGPATLRETLASPGCWDLILCDADSFQDLGVEDRLAVVRDDLDASLVLLTKDGPPRPAAWQRRGVADLVQRGDMDHLLMVCERELQNCAMRKELRGLRQMAGHGEQEMGAPLMLATINDLGKTARIALAPGTAADALGIDPPAPAEARIKSLIEAGGLTLEYQPIISFRAHEEHRGMFEALVRLRDEAGQLMLPDTFLPVVAQAGWMGKVDLWIFRRALATLEQIQKNGNPDAVLFVNLATATLQSGRLVAALGAMATAAQLTPGSLVVEARKAAFQEATEGLGRLAQALHAKHHGLLVEDVRLDDGGLLARHRNLITHIKLDREIAQGLVEGRLSQPALSEFVRGARRDGLRVIALAVESAELLSMLFTAGVDAIQGHFVSMPYSDLVYPTVQRVEASSSTPRWRVPIG